MPPASFPGDESQRLASLLACGILDTPPDPRFDALTRVAAKLFGTPLALVTLVDEDRQWFKSAVGLAAGGQTHRDFAICAHAILTPERPLVVEDATLDPRFADNPLVTGPPGIRFYAGAPLRDRDGRGLGTLCVLDTVPRPVSAEQVDMLMDLAAGVSTALELNRITAALSESEQHHRHAVALSPQIPWTADPAGQVLEAGPRWQALTGLPNEQTVGTGWISALHPDDRAPVLAAWSHALRTGEPVDTEYRLRRADGEYRWVRAYAAPRRGAGNRILRWYGTLEDVHDRKLAEIALADSEALARSVVEHSLDSVRVLDLEGRLLFMNRAGLREFGHADLDGLIGSRWDAVLPAENGAVCEAAMAEARAGGDARITVFSPDDAAGPGALRWWDVTISPIPGPDGRPARLLSVARDITGARRAQHALERARREAEQASAQLSAVLESTTDCVAVFDRDWRLTYTNERASKLFALRGLQVGQVIWDVFPDAVGGEFHRRYRDAMERRVPVEFETFAERFGVWFEVHAFPTANGLTVFFRDVSERRQAAVERQRAQAQLAHMARHDPLTGLANRTVLREELGSALEQAGSETQLALLCLDLDHFKAVNDTLGHQVGDLLLQQVAQRLRGTVRGGDTIIRFGGDEFAIIQPGIRHRDAVAQLARRIIATVSAPYELEGHVLNLGVSIGIALAPEHGTEAEQVFRKADLALYRAKAEHRGVFRFYETEMDVSLRQRQELKLSLRGAVQRGEFEVFYQPLVDLRSGRVASLEALLRWHHPVRGLVSPDEFIPVAEESCLIAAIGEWALRQACGEAAWWPSEVGIAVNLSPAQFRQQDLPACVAKVLAESGLPASRLALEVTESVLLQDDDRNVAILHALRALGVRIVMDDFGTGYSSLGYLRRFPFHKLKIDRSFVGDLPENEGSAEIVRSVVGLGRSLGIVTVAEGVETRQQLDLLRLMGCGEVQGYYFSPPVPAAEVPPLLARLDVEGFAPILPDEPGPRSLGGMSG